MKEKIIVAPGINGNELLCSMAMHGIKCFNTRVWSAGQLARMALLRSGIPVKENFINQREAAAIIAEAVKALGNQYFGKTTYSDIRAITFAVYRMRTLVPVGDEAKAIRHALDKGEFKEKNDALFAVYQKYMQILSEKHAVDSVSLIRRAIAECKPMGAEFNALEEYPLNPLEEALFEAVSGKNAAQCAINMQDLFAVKNPPVYDYDIKSFKNCYGAPNEVETILADVYKDKQLDKCTVAVTDTATYAQLFFDYALLYNIPVTFGCGIPIINSNPARLLSLYYHWKNDGFCGVDAVKEMLSGNVFDHNNLKKNLGVPDNFKWNAFYEVVGRLRLSTDKKKNDKRIEDYGKAVAKEESELDLQDEKERAIVEQKKQWIPYLEKMTDELELPAEEFISRYANIRKESSNEAEKLLAMLDNAAKKVIYEEMQIIRNTGVTSEQDDDIIQNVLKLFVCRQGSAEGKLHVTKIAGAAASMRENLYIAGLSASRYPGSPKENYLLLDKDLETFGKTEAEQFTSAGRIIRKINSVKQLARLAACLGTETNVSYSGLDVSELKKDNASSVVFALQKRNGNKFVTEDSIPYFAPPISVTKRIGEEYLKGNHIKQHDSVDDSVHADKVRCALNTKNGYSPSALDIFFQCKMRFLLKYIFEIPEPEEYDSFEIISAKSIGNLAHSLMKKLGNSTMDEKKFIELCGTYFDCYIAENPHLINGKETEKREQFLDIMERAYRLDPHNEVEISEQKLNCLHAETGVAIQGYPDRVERKADGTCTIVDFKTGKVIKHETDDIETCLQTVLYAYMLEQQGYKVNGGEFRYLDLQQVVSCKYDNDIKQQLKAKLQSFKQVMENGDFKPVTETEQKVVCKYCGFGTICGKNEQGGQADD